VKDNHDNKIMIDFEFRGLKTIFDVEKFNIEIF